MQRTGYYARLFWLLSLLSLPLLATAQSAADTLRTASGLRYLIRQAGHGPQAQPGDRVTINYTGFLPNGRIFESSASAGGPVRFRVGRNEVIPGWDELARLLPAGTRARAWLPARLAYGPRGSRDPDDDTHYLIPPDTDLEFEVEIVKIR